jgi:hypothetical protein
MELYAGGSGIQSGRLRARLAEYVEGGTAQVIGVLFEVRAGGCRWYSVGEVLESQL